MDPAWFEIIRRHPEIQVDADGKRVDLARNHNLKKYLSSEQCFSSDYMVSAIDSDEKYVQMMTIDDKLSVFDKKTMKLSSSLDIRDKLPLPLGLPISQTFPGTFLHRKAQFFTNMERIKDNGLMEIKDNRIGHRNRTVYITVDLFVETIGADPGTKKGKDKNAPVEIKPKTFMRYRIVIIDIYGNDGSTYIEKVADWYLGGEFNPDFDNFDTTKALCDDINCILSGNGRVLSLIQREPSSTQFHLFELPQVRVPCDVSQFSSTVPAGLGSPPTLIAQWKVSSFIGECEVLVLSDDSNSIVPDSSVSNSEEQIRSERVSFYENRVILLMGIQNCSYIPIVKFRAKPVEAPVNTKAAKPAKGAPEIPPPSTVLCVPYESARIRLGSPATTFAIEIISEQQEKDMKSAKVKSSKSKFYVLLAVGQMDGLITLWNLLENVCLSTLSQHRSLVTISRNGLGETEIIYGPSMITSLKIVSSFPGAAGAATAGNVTMVIAGAVDGTISFHSTSGCLFDDLRISSPKFVDFRHDRFEDPVLSIDIIKAPSSPAGLCCFVNHASGQKILYKLYKARYLLLVGSLTLDERVDFREIVSSYLSVSNIPREPFIPPHDVLNPPPPPEPVAQAKAGKGKDTAPVSEPVPEPTPEELEAIAVEEARVKAETYRNMMLGIKTASFTISECISIVQKGHCLRNLVGIGSLCSTDGVYYGSLSRDGGAGVAKFSFLPFIAKAMESDEVIHSFIESNKCGEMGFLQEASLALPSEVLQGGRGSTKGMSRVRSSLPQGSKAPSTATLNVGSVLSYKQVKLTEQRLHDHEKQLAVTRRGLFDSLSGSLLEEYGTEEDESLTIPRGPPPVDPLSITKGEILRFKRDKLKVRPGGFSKKLTALASLCS